MVTLTLQGALLYNRTNSSERNQEKGKCYHEDRANYFSKGRT